MRKLFSLFVAGLLAVSLGACDQQLTTPDSQSSDTEVRADHGATGTIEAGGTYRAVDSKAAKNHGFSVGDKVGSISVTDDGSNLTVTGEASGLNDDDSRYVSLFYDKASSAQGPRACEPGRNVGTGTDHPLSLTIKQMIIGPGSNTVNVLGLPHAAWVVGPSGAALGPAGTLEYVSADMVGTVSIRDLTIDGPIGPGTGPDAVVACAKVTHSPANPNG